MRKLASIQKIETIRPIEGADKIVVATMEGLGWECVIKKDEFKVGDLIVYFEVDSILPEIPEFEFLREKKFRIKTIKLKKQVSQGLIFGTSILPPKTSLEIGKDVTELLGVKKYDPQLLEESQIVSTQKQSKLLKFFMNYKLFRTIYLKLNQKHKGNWPDWISKTDEDRLAANPSILMKNFDKSWYLTEKIDGQSATFFTFKTKNFGFTKWEFGVASRNVWIKKQDQSNYWKAAKKYDLQTKLLKFKKPIVIQGEQISKSIQGNKYFRDEVEFFVFNIIEDGKRVPFKRLRELCKEFNLKHVPLLNDNCIPNNVESYKQNSLAETVNAITKDSEGESKLYNTEREGVVWRLCDNPNVSFKVISPKFLLKENN